MGFGKCKIELTWALFVVFVLSVPRYPEPQPEFASDAQQLLVPSVPKTQVVEGTIARNTTLVATLVDLDVPKALAHDLAELIQPVFDLRKIRTGYLFRLEKETDGTVRTFQYKIDDERVLKVERDADTYAAKVETLELESRETVVTAQITGTRNNLYAALDENLKSGELAAGLDSIFRWDVDFNSDLQPNDQIRLIVPALYNKGEFVKWGKIQAAELVNAGKTYRAFFFMDSYYDAKGNSFKRSLLASPLAFTRVSSGFTRRRLHPILGTNRPHLAVDYAAPTGTPVQAVANGTVTFAGWNTGYGNLVQIRHANGLTTGYAHLSRISPVVRAGRSIQQSDIVGAVGQTGLATGPHLHFMMTKGGTPINPLSMKSEPPVPIDAKLRPLFLAEIAPREAKLGSSSPGTGVAQRKLFPKVALLD